MSYRCSLCNENVEGDLIVFKEHTEEHIIDEIKKKHPEWVRKDGACQKCIDYFKAQLKGED